MRTNVYRDFDAFTDDVGDVDCTMTLQNMRRRHWSVTHLNLPGVHIQKGRLGSGNIVEGQSTSQGFLFYLPVSNECEYLGNGASFGRGDVWMLEPSAEFCLSTGIQHDWYTALIPSNKLFTPGDDPEPSESFERPTCKVLVPHRGTTKQLAMLVRDAVRAATHCATFENSYAAKRAAAAATSLARSLVGEPGANEPRRRGRPKATRLDVIRSCRTLLGEEPGKPLTVSDLATGAGVSERTLRTLFSAYFGVSPARYLLLRRLRAVHRALLTANVEETSVTDVLVRHGEWEFGRFAVRYRQLFGERPSETLARTCRGRVDGLVSNRCTQ